MSVKLLFAMFVILICFTACEKGAPEFSPFHYSFETERELNSISWKCHSLFGLSDSIALEGTKSLKVTFYANQSEPYPGFSFNRIKNNWQPSDTLLLNIFNPAEYLQTIVLRMDDAVNPSFADRYNQSFSLSPGWNAIRLPLNKIKTSGTNRILDAANISAIILFCTNVKFPVTLFFDAFQILFANKPLQ